MITKAEYLGSPILPSPLKVDVTVSIKHDSIEIIELGVLVFPDKVHNIRMIRCSELPAQTMMMAGVVGLVVNKEKPYVVMEFKMDRMERDIGGGVTINDVILLTFEDDNMAGQFADELCSQLAAARDKQKSAGLLMDGQRL